MYTLDIPHKTEYAVLLNVWESAVRATHHFLQKNDINVFKKIILEKEIFSQVSITCARDSNNLFSGESVPWFCAFACRTRRITERLNIH